jgi:phage-related protein
MQNYIILNGQISTNIPGLLISELPPITKPLIRTEVEEIDGRDGDIVTKLGYSAYNKEFTIGLYGDYDINKVIHYFNSEGTVTFSNEEDKYYNYQILDQIDFERLIRFRTATVVMHVQPFKYSAQDNNKTFTINNNLLSFKNITKNSNGIVSKMANGICSIDGKGVSGYTEVYIPINPLELSAGSYTLNAASNGTGANACIMRLIETAPTDAETFGGSSITLVDNATVTQTDTITETTTFNYLWLYITPNIDVDFTLNVEVTNNSPTGNISIRNAGNIYSKPIITINGTGLIDLSLNNQVLFNLDMQTFNSITIDTNLMEAYNSLQLLNRYVTGDYDNFKLNIGLNTVSWSGNITSIEISNYSRWI